MKTTVIFILVLVPQLCFGQQDRRPDKTSLTIATLNTEFLWDGREPEEGTVELPYRGNPAEAEAHMADVAEVIRSVNADIINLVELENIEALTLLNTIFLSGMGYKPYLVKGTDFSTGQDVGLLSRIDPVGDIIERYAAKGRSGNVEKAVSKNYFAKFNVDGLQFAIIGLHFLAGPNRTDRQLQRQAQANAMTTLARQLASEGNAIIICGDANDYDGQVFDHISSHPITTVLSEMKALDPSVISDDLVNVASFIPQNERYSAFWDKNDNANIDFPNEFTSIDHMLISPALAINVSKARIIHDHDPRLVTDHFPVAFSLKTTAVPTPNIMAHAVRMVSLLANPSGDENQNETITIRNFGITAVDVTGWKFKDLAKQQWVLNGILQPNEQKIIKRNGQRMGLNNSGDTIDFLTVEGTLIQSFTYFASEEDAQIVVEATQL